MSVLVFVPKDRYDTQARRRIGEFLAAIYEGRVSAAYPAYPEGPLARTHYIIGRDEGQTPQVARETLEKGIAAIVRTWSDALRDALDETIGGARARSLATRYAERLQRRLSRGLRRRAGHRRHRASGAALGGAAARRRSLPPRGRRRNTRAT